MNGWRWALPVSLLAHGIVLFAFSHDLHQVDPPVPGAVSLQIVPRPAPPLVRTVVQPPAALRRPPHSMTTPPASNHRAEENRRLTAPPVLAVSRPDAPAQVPVPVAIPGPSEAVRPPVSAPSVAPSVSPPVTAQPTVAERPIVTPEDLRALCFRRPPPDYPAVARRRGEEGKVLLRISLDAAGRVSDAQLIASSGSRWLDEAALAAIGRWGCRPAMRQGVAVPSVATQTFSFVLQDGGG